MAFGQYSLEEMLKEAKETRASFGTSSSRGGRTSARPRGGGNMGNASGARNNGVRGRHSNAGSSTATRAFAHGSAAGRNAGAARGSGGIPSSRSAGQAVMYPPPYEARNTATRPTMTRPLQQGMNHQLQTQERKPTLPAPKNPSTGPAAQANPAVNDSQPKVIIKWVFEEDDTTTSSHNGVEGEVKAAQGTPTVAEAVQDVKVSHANDTAVATEGEAQATGVHHASAAAAVVGAKESIAPRINWVDAEVFEKVVAAHEKTSQAAATTTPEELIAIDSGYSSAVKTSGQAAAPIKTSPKEDIVAQMTQLTVESNEEILAASGVNFFSQNGDPVSVQSTPTAWSTPTASKVKSWELIAPAPFQVVTQAAATASTARPIALPPPGSIVYWDPSGEREDEVILRSPSTLRAQANAYIPRSLAASRHAG